jgi:hypothetical protein
MTTLFLQNAVGVSPALRIHHPIPTFVPLSGIVPLQTVSKKMLGEIGEDMPPCEFTDIQNLNNIKPNFPIFDIIARKNGEIYVFSAKARNRYGANGKLNPCYNILSGGNILTRKYKKALEYLTEMGHDIDKIHYCFLVCPLEENKSCVYYWGEFTDINPLCTSANIVENRISYFGVPVSDVCLAKYKILGKFEWEYVKEKYLSSGLP